MKLLEVRLDGFRGYDQEIRIAFNDFTALIGKNDVGKSSVFEALDIFFNASKMEIEDKCVHVENSKVSITCIFEISSIDKIIIDTTNETTLEQEYLLNKDGNLQIRKEYDFSKGASVKEQVYIEAIHPEIDILENKEVSLLNVKMSELKRMAEKSGVIEEVNNKATCARFREAIWRGKPKKETKIPLNKEDAKQIANQLSQYFPIFSLFKSDRLSSDKDNEAQDPMKTAIKEVLGELQEKTEEINNHIKDRLTEIAGNTINKLKDFDEGLADELIPRIDDPKWDSLFKISIEDGNGIPMNKRGSGIRRLILLSFFRSKVEETRQSKNVIYAFEEPETSQHPNFQKIILDTLYALSNKEKTQVMITTHSPSLLEAVYHYDVRFLIKENNNLHILDTDDFDEERNLIHKVFDDMGFSTFNVKENQCILFLEGTTDRDYMRKFAELLGKESLFKDGKFIMLDVGGAGSMKKFYADKVLQEFKGKYLFIVDRDSNSDSDVKLETKKHIDNINEEEANGFAIATQKREMENYLSSSCFQRNLKELSPIIGLQEVLIDDNCDVERKIRDITTGEFRVKGYLVKNVLPNLTLEDLEERCAMDELNKWFSIMEDMYNGKKSMEEIKKQYS